MSDYFHQSVENCSIYSLISLSELSFNFFIKFLINLFSLSGYLVHPFHWPTYLEWSNSSAAPDSLFNLVMPAFKYSGILFVFCFVFLSPKRKQELVWKSEWCDKLWVNLQCSTEGRETTFGLSYQEITSR